MSPKITTAHEQGQRDRILEAATRCFAQRGFHQATIQDICDRAGLSKGGLYTYFRSKDEILAALIECNLSDAMRWATNAAGQATSALQRLERIAEAMIESVIEGAGSRAHTPQLMLEVWAEASKDPQLGDLLARGYDHWRTFIAQLFREGIASGEIRADIDPEVLAAICVAMFDGLTLQESITKTKVNWRHVVATLRQTLIEGVVAAAKPPQEA
ncbi:MAG TPA: TetR/AcrR family transcriptional regulator [bacterium]|jgi:AcrR family transcriptional regulator|nr:TetR/AcrR family transcriptional regulator [bacterium]